VVVVGADFLWRNNGIPEGFEFGDVGFESELLEFFVEQWQGACGFPVFNCSWLVLLE
jgi:hypothetical protein